MQYIYISIFKVSKHNINVCIDLYSFRLSSRPYIRKLNTVNIQYFPCWNAAFFLRQRNGEVIFYISMLPPSVLNKCTCPAPYLYSSFLMHHKWPKGAPFCFEAAVWHGCVLTYWPLRSVGPSSSSGSTKGRDCIVRACCVYKGMYW